MVVAQTVVVSKLAPIVQGIGQARWLTVSTAHGLNCIQKTFTGRAVQKWWTEDDPLPPSCQNPILVHDRRHSDHFTYTHQDRFVAR